MMEFEFDKEIDVLLRKARDSETVFAAENNQSAPRHAHAEHLDADAISAFAENALPERAKQFYTAHLAECASCRKILSNLIVLNSEAVAVTAASSAVSEKTVEPSIPWYRKLFIFPQLTYTMGALVVLFSGFLGFLVLQSLIVSKNSEVSFSTGKAPEPQVNPTVFSSSGTANANTASSSNTAANTTATTNTAPALSNTTATNTTTADPVTSGNSSNAASVAPLATPGILSASPRDETKTKDEEKDDLAVAQQAPQVNQPSAGATVPRENNKNQTEDSARSQDDSKLMERQKSRTDLLRKSPVPPKPQKKESVPGETRSVGGKTFNNVGGIWFDSAYTNQTAKTVARGTSEYQKLDAGMRSIAEALGGTVVIIWKGKAYRIQ